MGVKALLRNREGRFLLVKRSSEKYPEVGAKWDIVGGRINLGETLMKNLRREINEEVGLELEEEPKLVAAQDILRMPGRHVVRLTYVGKIDGQPQLDGDHTEFRWFTLEELRELGEERLDVFFKELLDKNVINEGLLRGA